MDFYTQNGFKLFPCKMDKSPNISTSGIGWRDPEAHLTQSEAEELADRGNLIGAWIPDNMIVIDIDRNHVDKLGNPKEEQMKAALSSPGLWTHLTVLRIILTICHSSAPRLDLPGMECPMLG